MDDMHELRLGFPRKSLNGRVFSRTRQMTGTRSRRNKVGVNLRAVAEVLDEYGMNPAEEVIRLIREDRLDDEMKARLMMEMLEYVQPKLQRTELTGKDGGALTVEILRFADQAPE